MNKYDNVYPAHTKHLVDLALHGMDGTYWYPIAWNEIQHICQRENWDATRFAAILSLTSPRVSVRRNVRITLQYMQHNTFLANTLGSIRQSVANWLDGKPMKGQKVKAFFQAITGDSTALVLDVHMANALNVPQDAFRRKPIQKRCYERVERVADTLELSIRSTQACIWFGQKRVQGENPEPFPLLWEYGNFLRYDKQFPSSGYIPGISESEALNYVD